MSKHNPFAFGQPITLDNLDQLFAHHRAHTGGWRMEKDDEGDKGDDANKGNDDKPTFEPITSQEEFDRRLGPRLARERDKYSDYADLKRKADEYDKAAEAAKTEQEKAVDAARKEGETGALAKVNARVIAAEAKVLAAQANAHSASAAVKMLDLSGITVGDDGEVDTKALQAAIDALKTSDPYLFGDGKKNPKADRSQGGDGARTDAAGVDKGRELFESRRKKKSS